MYFKKLKTGPPESTEEPDSQLDEDIVKEQRRILSPQGAGDLVTVLKLRKEYNTHPILRWRNKTLVAVNNLSFGVPRGQLFGLLGSNGAGKTTTFKMLTGDLLPTSGHVIANGVDLSSHYRKSGKSLVGYCPQSNALLEAMTGYQILRLYAILHGISDQDIDRHVNTLMNLVGISKYAQKKCGTYSGGNKRKLCVAISLVGCPKVVYLDEPTAGIDPAARRVLWDLLLNYVDMGNVILLTSHSMEECEALCHRLIIISRGVAKCIGSVQHLKSRFGNEICIFIKVKDTSKRL
ncbi:hypothetical protein Zmor_004329 [Zophobas morio]|uniref:ABC transporter domain-containing protein n=1 Tax=Zophobas morio TaxID=2755281 RepID=A0AA38HJC9_9CUCU|nr:hypothetical protein Zmor_004329 [Zophobas morio]